MSFRSASILGLRPKAPLILISILLAILWLAGGASRGDVFGQSVVRFAAWSILAIVALSAARLDFRECKPIAWLMIGIATIPVAQLLPLPESLWAGLAGRELLVSSLSSTAIERPWRPLSISPGATLNALSSLIVPTVALILLVSIQKSERSWLMTILLLLIIASIFVGLLQFSGAGFNNVLINHVRGSVSGTFANRNHFALLLALGCLIAPVWAFQRRDQLSWRIPFAISFVLLASLTILASGSRAGIALGALALILCPLIIREDVRKMFRHMPRWVMPTAVVVIIAVIFSFVIVSIVSGRATSIDRLAMLDVAEDMRGLGLATVSSIISANFAFGIGMGGFDPVFRIFEPHELLQVFYFNHAHNDWMEVALEAGLLGLILMVATLLWWGRASVRVWRHAKSASTEQVIGRLGSAIILFVLLASAVDYPARTPLVMAITIIAACWLAWGAQAAHNAMSLPKESPSL